MTNQSSYLLSKHLESPCERCKQIKLLKSIQELEKERDGLLKAANDPLKGGCAAVNLIYAKTRLEKLWKEYNKI